MTQLIKVGVICAGAVYEVTGSHTPRYPDPGPYIAGSFFVWEKTVPFVTFTDRCCFGGWPQLSSRVTALAGAPTSHEAVITITARLRVKVYRFIMRNLQSHQQHIAMLHRSYSLSSRARSACWDAPLPHRSLRRRRNHFCWFLHNYVARHVIMCKRILPYAAVFFKIVAVPAVLDQFHGSSCS